MNLAKYLAPLIVAPSLALTQPAFAQNTEPNQNQKLTRYAKPAVVRIVNICYGVYADHYASNRTELGTGFLINPDGYIVTSSKFFNNEKECKQKLSERILDNFQEQFIGKNITEKTIFNYLNSKQNNNKFKYEEFVILPKPDTKPFRYKIKKSGREDNQNTEASGDIAVIKIPISNAPAIELGDSNQVKIQDSLIMIGYPTNADINLEQDLSGLFAGINDLVGESFFEASVAEGRISNPNKTLPDGNPVLQIDILENSGIIGSPLINDQGQVIGMLVSSESQQNNNIPQALPTTKILEFVRQSGATNVRGNTDKFYSQGLKNFWNGNYKEARANFLKVKGLFQNHSEIDSLISEIDQIEAERWAKPWTNPTYIFTAVLLLAAGVVGGVTYFLLKQKSNLVPANAGGRRNATGGNSVFTSSFKSNGRGKKCFIEMEYKGQIQRFQLSRDEQHLGRDPAWSDFDLPTSWEVVSRQHAILKKEGEDYRIFDGDGKIPSRNGLWVNDDYRVDPQDGYLLNNGDQLKIGQDASEQILLTYYNPNSEQANLKSTMFN